MLRYLWIFLTLVTCGACADLPGDPIREDAGSEPDLRQMTQPDTRVTGPDLAPAGPDLKPRGVSDATSPDTTFMAPADTRPGVDLTAVVPQDTKPQQDTLPLYVNVQGWSPDSLGACCLSCESNYAGCRYLVYTTPYCTPGGAYSGKTPCVGGGAPDPAKPGIATVWPLCLPITNPTLTGNWQCGSAGM